MKFSYAIVLILAFLLSSPAAAQADTPALTVTTNEVEIEFPTLIRFRLAGVHQEKIERVTLLYGTNGQSCQPSGAKQVVDIEPGQSVEAEWEWDLERSGVIPPGVELWWQWEIEAATGVVQLTDRMTVTVNDTRHEWNQISETVGDAATLTVQWYSGDQVFGQTLMNMALDSLARLAAEMGVQPSGAIWITVYPSVEEVQEALIHTQEWTGAVAFPNFGSILIGVTRANLDWAAEVIPHELTHLVVEARVFNCRGVNLPTWLNEGLAVFSEGPTTTEDEAQVIAALQAGELPSLRSLARGFSAYTSSAILSYTQSGLVVRFMLETYSAEKMGELLTAMQGGLTIDEALNQVYQFDTDGLDAAWRTALGFEPALQPTAEGAANTRTPVPTLALYTLAIKPSPTPAPPQATDTPVPTPTATAAPGPAATEPPATQPPAPEPPALPTPLPDTPTPPPTGPKPLPGCAGAGAMPLVLLGIVKAARSGFYTRYRHR